MSTKSKSSKKKPATESQEEKKADIEAKKRFGYLDSTQCKNWLFPSYDEIKQKQLKSFKNEIKSMQQKLNNNKLSIPSDEEYIVSLSYYCKEIIEICRKFRFPPYVSCTAVTYFKRFFLNQKWNLINIDPESMKDTCIYLASKTEQCLFTGVKQLTDVTKTESEQVIENELTLMDGISFQLKIWNPIRSFRSFFNDFKGIYKRKLSKPLNDKYEQQIWKQGHDLIQDSYISDVCLIYTPSQIALASLLLVISCIDVKNIQKNKDQENEIKQIKRMAQIYFKERFEGKNSKDIEKKKQMDLLKETTNKIQQMVINGMNKTNPNSKKDQNKASAANLKLFNLRVKFYEMTMNQNQNQHQNKNKNRNKKRSPSKQNININTNNGPQNMNNIGIKQENGITPKMENLRINQNTNNANMAPKNMRQQPVINKQNVAKKPKKEGRKLKLKLRKSKRKNTNSNPPNQPPAKRQRINQ